MDPWCAETYTVPKQVKILLQSIAGKNVKKTDAILDVPVLKQRLLKIDREIIEYNDNYGWWK